jgi:hypothetical protein
MDSDNFTLKHAVIARQATTRQSHLIATFVDATAAKECAGITRLFLKATRPTEKWAVHTVEWTLFP